MVVCEPSYLVVPRYDSSFRVALKALLRTVVAVAVVDAVAAEADVEEDADVERTRERERATREERAESRRSPPRLRYTNSWLSSD